MVVAITCMEALLNFLSSHHIVGGVLSSMASLVFVLEGSLNVVVGLSFLG